MYVRRFIDAYLRPKSNLTHNLANFRSAEKDCRSCSKSQHIAKFRRRYASKRRVYESMLPFCHSDLQDRRTSDQCRYSWEWGSGVDRKRRQKAVKQGQFSLESTDSYLRLFLPLTHISPFWRIYVSNDNGWGTQAALQSCALKVPM